MNIPIFIIYSAMLIHGAFEYKNAEPDSLFPVQVAIHDYSSPVIMTNPALLPFSEGLLLQSYAGRPYSNEALTAAGSAIQYGTGDYGFQLSWNSFGSDFYRENTFSLNGGYSIYPFLHTGISAKIYLLRINTEELYEFNTIPETDFAVLLTPYSWLNMSIIQSGIFSLATGQKSEVIYPERSAGVLLKPGNGFSLAWNITDTAAGMVNTFSAVVNPVTFFSVKGGYCIENSSFAASIGILSENFYVSYGLKYHPYMGYTHSIGITYTPQTKIESLHYGKPVFSSPVKKINITTAVYDDLKTIEGLSEISAQRIILYREKIGPVNGKGLMQIGLTGEEIKILEANVYGLARVSRNKNGKKDFSISRKKFVKMPPRNERIKNRFRQLIGSGIPAFKAITYSELVESGKTDEIQKALLNDNSLSEEQKKIIEKTCSR